MGNIYLTADTHLSHSNIIKYCNRPFKDAHHMNTVLIDNINSLVQHNDILWHLGDFCFKGDKTPDFFRGMINCRNVNLILGNHDDHNISKYKTFSSVQHYKELRYDGRLITLNHYAQRVWRNSCHGSIHLYGHSHSKLPGQGRSCDVGVDCWDMKPVLLDHLINHLEKIDIHDKV